MNPRPATTTAAALSALALALGAVGCGNSASSGTATSATSGAPSTTASGSTAGNASNASNAPSAGSGGSTGGTGGSGSSASTRCRTDELKADVQLQKEGSAMVVLTNKGSRTCTVYGYLGYGGLLADNSAVNLATKREAYPGAPVRSTLKPGTSAFSGLKWASCDKADASCRVLAGVRVTPPDETTQLTATVIGLDGNPVQQLPVSAAGFTVGSLQPSNEGVVFP